MRRGGRPGRSPLAGDPQRRYARCCLLAPGVGELLDREDLDDARAARALGIPTDELRIAIAEHQREQTAPAPSAPRRD